MQYGRDANRNWFWFPFGTSVSLASSRINLPRVALPSVVLPSLRLCVSASLRLYVSASLRLCVPPSTASCLAWVCHAICEANVAHCEHLLITSKCCQLKSAFYDYFKELTGISFYALTLWLLYVKPDFKPKL